MNFSGTTLIILTLAGLIAFGVLIGLGYYIAAVVVGVLTIVSGFNLILKIGLSLWNH